MKAVSGKKAVPTAVKLQPDIDTTPELHGTLAAHFAKRGQLRAAVASAERALRLARAAGRDRVAPGEVVTCRVDLAMMHDSGGPRRVKPILG